MNPSNLAVKLANWREPINQETKAVFDLTLEDYGITIHGCKLHQQGKARWLQFPKGVSFQKRFSKDIFQRANVIVSKASVGEVAR